MNAPAQEWTIHVCVDCGVQHYPHAKGCPQERRFRLFEWRPVVVVEKRTS